MSIQPREPSVPTLIQYTRQDVERLADILALITVALGIMMSGSWAGKDNWIVALAIGAAIAYLVVNYNGPVRVFLRNIFAQVLEALFEFVNFLYAWLYMAGQYYGGRFLRMLVDIVTWTLAGGLFTMFFRFPAVQQFWTILNNIISTTFQIAQQAISAVQTGLENFRQWARDQITALFAQLDALAADVATKLGNLQTFVLQRLQQGLDDLRTEMVLSLDAVFRRALAVISTVEASLRTALDDTRTWVLQQIGPLTVRVGDVEVKIGLADLYSALVASGAFLPAPDHAPGGPVEVQLAGLGTEEGGIQAVMDGLIEDIAATARGAAPVEPLAQANAALDDLIAALLPAPPPEKIA